MSDWQDPWDSPQLFSVATQEPEYYSQLVERTTRANRSKNRYYCPECGEVGYGYQRYHGGWVVEEHSKCYPASGRNDYFYRLCPGGSIDPEKDRAP